MTTMTTITTKEELTRQELHKCNTTTATMMTLPQECCPGIGPQGEGMQKVVFWCAGDPHEGGRRTSEEGGFRLHWQERG